MKTATKVTAGQKEVDRLMDAWKSKHFPPVARDENWEKLKWHVCTAREAVNPLLRSKGGEIEVEQFGIIGWLWKVENQTFPKKDLYFYQCPLIEARETGTGKFGEWLQNVKAFVRKEFDAPFALTNITNQHLYKYCMKYNVPVAVEYRLYNVEVKGRQKH
jgi:hypothetical protein